MRLCGGGDVEWLASIYWAWECIRESNTTDKAIRVSLSLNNSIKQWTAMLNMVSTGQRYRSLESSVESIMSRALLREGKRIAMFSVQTSECFAQRTNQLIKSCAIVNCVRTAVDSPPHTASTRVWWSWSRVDKQARFNRRLYYHLLALLKNCMFSAPFAANGAGNHKYISIQCNG